MKKHLLTCIAVLSTAGISLFAQPVINKHFLQNVTLPMHRSCGTMDYEAWMQQQDPSRASARQAFEQQIQTYIAAHPNLQDNRATITCPVVVHVVYKLPAQNISDNQVLSQIQVLNEDFGRTNSDASQTPAVWQSIAANTTIQFCLATVDPNGNSTNGIDRVSTTVTSWSTNNAIKHAANGGANAWDPTRYLNIWVGNLGGGLLGYGEFPTSSVSQTYGVVILYSAFGSNYTSYGTFTDITSPYDKGRTTTHEFSHCFNLYHIWGDDGGACSGTDYCADTPNQADATYGSPSGVLTDACSPSSPGIMYENYMDYSDDGVMNLFTNNQKTRMLAVLNSAPYNALQTSNACGTVPALDAGISAITTPSGTVCNATFTPLVTLRNYGTTTLTSCTIQYKIDAQSFQNYSWSGSLTSGNSANVTLNAMTTTAGTHTFTCKTTNPNSSTDGNATNDQLTSTFTVTGTGQNLPYSEGFENAAFPPTGCTLVNPDNLTTWARVTNAHKTGVASMYMDNFNYNANGQTDDLVLPNLNLSSASSPVLTFQVAYQLYTNPASNPNYSDTLHVDISTNCGATWTTLYNKYGTNLTTTTPTYSTTSFVPTANQWRMETISLASYQSQNNVMIRFRNITDYENQMYIDDINIQNITDIQNFDLNSALNVFPNPTAGMVNVNVTLPSEQDLKITVYNALGQMLQQNDEGTTFGGLYTLDLGSQTDGIYFIEVRTNDATAIRRVVINR